MITLIAIGLLILPLITLDGFNYISNNEQFLDSSEFVFNFDEPIGTELNETSSSSGSAVNWNFNGPKTDGQGNLILGYAGNVNFVGPNDLTVRTLALDSIISGSGVYLIECIIDSFDLSKTWDLESSSLPEKGLKMYIRSGQNSESEGIYNGFVTSSNGGLQIQRGMSNYEHSVSNISYDNYPISLINYNFIESLQSTDKLILQTFIDLDTGNWFSRSRLYKLDNNRWLSLGSGSGFDSIGSINISMKKDPSDSWGNGIIGDYVKIDSISLRKVVGISLPFIDTDDDGIDDENDAFPLDPLEYLDTDNDGIGNNADTDDDEDFVEDVNDAFPLDPNESSDADNDGIGDNADIDNDNDGISNNRDIAPFIRDESSAATLASLDGMIEIMIADSGYITVAHFEEANAYNAFTLFEGQLASPAYSGTSNWNNINQSSTDGDYPGNGYWHFIEPSINTVSKFSYTWQDSDLSYNESGVGFFYDDRIDLDKDGTADGIQIASGVPFPSEDSNLDFQLIYDTLADNLDSFTPIIGVVDPRYKEKNIYHEIMKFEFTNGSILDTSTGSDPNNKFWPQSGKYYLDSSDIGNYHIGAISSLSEENLGFSVGSTNDERFTITRKHLQSNTNIYDIYNGLLNENLYLKAPDWETTGNILNTLTNELIPYIKTHHIITGVHGFRNPIINGLNFIPDEGFGINEGKIKIAFKIKNWNLSNGLDGKFPRPESFNPWTAFVIHLVTASNKYIGGPRVQGSVHGTSLWGHGYNPNAWGYNIEFLDEEGFNIRIGDPYGSFEEAKIIELIIDLDNSTYTLNYEGNSYNLDAQYPLDGLTVHGVKFATNNFDLFNFITVDDITISATHPKDSDSDGIFDMYEEYNTYGLEIKTDRFNPDSDSDGLIDGEETFLYHTDPTLPDSDGDGLIDGAEVIALNTNPNNEDSDGDSLLDLVEVQAGTNPNLSDTDSDGLDDSQEITFNTNPNIDDTSGDGLKDGEVANAGFDPTVDYTNLKNVISQGIQDLRPGSTMIEVSGNQATVQLQMEESSDLESWTETGTQATMTIPADTDTKFFRFKMAE